MCTTTDLSEFGQWELNKLADLLTSWNEQGLPEDFEASGITPMFNKNSGHVFLTNLEFQVCMMNGGDLESFYTCRNCGHEGFAGDCDLEGEGCNECNAEYLDKVFNDRLDVKRAILDQYESLSEEAYIIGFDDLVEIGTDRLINWLKDIGFKWGYLLTAEQVREYENLDLFELIQDYEKQ